MKDTQETTTVDKKCSDVHMVSTKDSRSKTQGLGTGMRFWADSRSRQ